MKILRSFLVLGLAAAFALGASGCAPTLNLEPGPDANNPGCAEVVVRLPNQLGELPSRNTNAQGTGAWGEPASVILRWPDGGHLERGISIGVGRVYRCAR